MSGRLAHDGHRVEVEPRCRRARGGRQIADAHVPCARNADRREVERIAPGDHRVGRGGLPGSPFT